jgi:DNA-binding NtrC family response regulator
LTGHASPGADLPILIVEDKDSLRTMLRHALEAQGHLVIEARDQPEAERLLREAEPSMVLSDLRLPAGDGFGVLRAAKEADPDLAVIVMTAYGSIEDAVSAMKEGALDFLAKPVDPDHLLLLVERALARRRMLVEYRQLKDEAARRGGAPNIIGQAPSLKKVLAALQRAASTDATVLLEGESGTGKELFARSLHVQSGRSRGPFIAINCAAIPEGLLEAELFGYEKGAFTGATQRKPGRFEQAHHGTLFLDEIGELPIGLQAKILRAIEERCFERLGGSATLTVDLRVVAATNRNLRQAVAARQFREDLYFRLSVLPITIPPLRDRPGDISILAEHFIGKYAQELGKPRMTLTPSALEALEAYAWPGNVRELQNCIERSVILADGQSLHVRHLNVPAAATPEAASPWAGIDLTGSLEEAAARVTREVETRKIREALDTAAGDRARAADLLQIGYRTLITKMQALGLSGES